MNNYNDGFFEKAFDFIMDYGLGLPVTVTGCSKHPLIRVVGILLMFFWAIPALLIFGIPLFITAVGMAVEDAYKGTLCG